MDDGGALRPERAEEQQVHTKPRGTRARKGERERRWVSGAARWSDVEGKQRESGEEKKEGQHCGEEKGGALVQSGSNNSSKVTRPARHGHVGRGRQK